MKRLTTITLGLMALSCGGGDTDADSPAPAAEVAGPTIEAESSRGTFVARITPLADPIPMNEPFAVTLELVDAASGEALEGVDDVTIDARMPAHRHGMLRDVELVEAEGKLRADGMLMHMVGHWEIHVDVRRGAHVERAQASVHLAH